MGQLTTLDKIGYVLLLVVLTFGLYFGFTDADFFDNTYSREDGAVEYATSVMLFLIALLCISRLGKLGKYKPLLWKLGVLGFALIFIFGAGEEISWGQRIFGIESGDFFKNNNAQEETNLHNLVVGETKLNKLIFSQLLMIVMLMYLLVTPILYRKKEQIKKLTKQICCTCSKMASYYCFYCVHSIGFNYSFF